MEQKLLGQVLEHVVKHLSFYPLLELKVILSHSRFFIDEISVALVGRNQVCPLVLEAVDPKLGKALLEDCFASRHSVQQRLRS